MQILGQFPRLPEPETPIMEPELCVLTSPQSDSHEFENPCSRQVLPVQQNLPR